MSLLLLQLLCALDAPTLAVVVDSKRPGTEHDADELASALYLALIDAGVPREGVLVEEQAERRTLTGAFSRTRDCQGRTACLRTLAQLLGPDAVVAGVDV